MRALLSAEAADGDGDGGHARRDEIALRQKRTHNKDFMLAWDNACMKMNGWGLSQFVPTRTVGALAPDAVRYFVPMNCPVTGLPRQRACIRTVGGTRFLKYHAVYRIPLLIGRLHSFAWTWARSGGLASIGPFGVPRSEVR